MSYHAAIVILNDNGLPDRLSLASHALRELVEKLPSDDMAVDMEADLNAKVNALRSTWEEAITEERRRGGEQWGDGVGKALRAFLDAVAELFRGREGIGAGRRDQAVRFLNRLDVPAIPLPADVQRQNAQDWMRLRAYFNDFSHHRFVEEERVFQERVMQLESFLSARLVPRPTDDFAAIDALLEEKEHDADA